MLKQSVNLKLGTKLKLTPQLKASIRILQMSILDLENEIHEQLEQNVMLERIDHQQTDESSHLSNTDEANRKDVADITTENLQTTNDTWDDIATRELDPNYDQFNKQQKSHDSLQKRPEIADNKIATLYEHLAEQLKLEFVSSEQRLVYEFLIDALSLDGLLLESLESIHQDLQKHIPEILLEDVKASLKTLQNCDPLGIGATSLAECLHIQITKIKQEQKKSSRINQKLISNETFRVADEICNHLPTLAKNDLKTLRSVCQTSMTELNRGIEIIRSLNPRPAASFAQTESLHIIPDVVVKRHHAKWVLEINQRNIPKIAINREYAACIRGAKNEGLKQQLQDARFLLNGLEMRQQTLVKLSKAILQKQKSFFEDGEIAMQPMLMRDLAEELEVHESTISRVVANKFMQTPRGTYPLRFFFSSSVAADDGTSHSATAIKGEINILVKNEDKSKPLSDIKISKLLNEKGITVARRTVAKYREALGIPSTSERRQR